MLAAAGTQVAAEAASTLDDALNEDSDKDKDI